MNKESTPEAVGRRWFEEVWQQRSVNSISALLTQDAKGHLEGGQEIEGPAEFIIFQQQLLSALPDLRLEVLHLLADDQQVCVHWKVDATHTGDGLAGTAGIRRSF